MNPTPRTFLPWPSVVLPRALMSLPSPFPHQHVPAGKALVDSRAQGILGNRAYSSDALGSGVGGRGRNLVGRGSWDCFETTLTSC